MGDVVLAAAEGARLQLSKMSKVSGACTPMVGCSEAAGCQAR
jgi:hypothetical protein